MLGFIHGLKFRSGLGFMHGLKFTHVLGFMLGLGLILSNDIVGFLANSALIGGQFTG